MKRQILRLLIATTLSFNFGHCKEETERYDSHTLHQHFAQLQKSIDQQTAATTRQNALLEEQNKLTKALLTVMLKNAQQEQTMLQLAQQEAEEAQRLDLQKQTRRKQLQEERQNRPWYHKAWDVTSHVITVYLVHSLFPEIKRAITIRLADKGLQCICNGVDMATGDFVEQHWGSHYAYRPGEWLLKTPTGREQAQTKREIARNHPDIVQLSKERDALKKEIYPHALRTKLQEELYALHRFKNSNGSNHNPESGHSSNDAAHETLYKRYLQGRPTVEEPND